MCGCGLGCWKASQPALEASGVGMFCQPILPKGAVGHVKGTVINTYCLLVCCLRLSDGSLQEDGDRPGLQVQGWPDEAAEPQLFASCQLEGAEADCWCLTGWVLMDGSCGLGGCSSGVVSLEFLVLTRQGVGVLGGVWCPHLGLVVPVRHIAGIDK